MVAAAAEYDPSLAVLGAPGSALLRAADAAGLEPVPEAFADRAYLRDGRLVATIRARRPADRAGRGRRPGGAPRHRARGRVRRRLRRARRGALDLRPRRHAGSRRARPRRSATRSMRPASPCTRSRRDAARSCRAARAPGSSSFPPTTSSATPPRSVRRRRPGGRRRRAGGHDRARRARRSRRDASGSGSGCARLPRRPRPTSTTVRRSRSPSATTATTSPRWPTTCGLSRGRGRRPPPSSDVPLRVLRVRTGLRLPHRARPGAAPPAPADPAHPSAGRLGRHRRRVRRRVPVAVAGRLAPDRPHRRADVGRRPPAAGAPRSGHAREIRRSRDGPPRDRRRLGDDDPGRRPSRVRRRRRGDERCAGRRAARRAQPAGRQPARTPPCWRRSAGCASGRRRRSSWRRAPTALRPRVPAGEVVDVEPAAGELWGYLAVRGGIAVEPVLGFAQPGLAIGTRATSDHVGRRAAGRGRPRHADRHRPRAAAAAERGRRRLAGTARRLVRRRRPRPARGVGLDRVARRQPRRRPTRRHADRPLAPRASCRARGW